ncbi:MAG: SRPBCC family protein [Burkholderiales bacterium]|nr:SRPBCC family protein [Burkholderiales bacterium]
MATTTNTVRLHRVLRCPPERLYRAFTQPGAFERWLPPFGFVGKVDKMDAVVGGSWHMSFTNFGSGSSHSFGGKYLELVPGQRIAYEATFDGGMLPGTMKTTVVLTAVSCGTDMSVVQEGIPAMIPVEMCYLGWQESLVALAQLVEPDIPG